MTEQRRARLRPLREVLLTVGAVLGLTCVALFVASTAFSIKPLVFRSGSMEPAVQTGALALARTVDADSLKVNDVVSVVKDGRRVTHRIVGMEKDGDAHELTLKGDANAVVDAEPYTVSSADRVFVDVPKLGYVVAWLSSPAGVFVAGAYVASMLFMSIGRRPRAGRHAVSGTSAAALVVLAISVAAPPAVRGTWATFTDQAAMTDGVISTTTVPKPAYVNCDVNNPLLGTKSLTTTWSAASQPPGITYSAVVRESGTSLTVTSSGSDRSAKVTGGLLGTLLGNTFHIDVTAHLPGTTWTAASTQSATYVLLGLGFTCGTWS